MVLCAGLLAAQTQPAPDKCRVEGTVLNSVTGQPVPRVVVTLRSIGSFSRLPGNVAAPATASTDAEGRFVFTSLAAGSYQISAQRDNFQYIPSRRSEPLDLNAGDQKKDVLVQITPLGAIAGRVQNEEGDALPNVQVSVMIYQYTQAGRQLMARNSASTNDLGEYRIFGLASGKYFVRAATFSGRVAASPDETYLPMYYPGATDPSAAAMVELGAGQDMRSVDFTLHRIRAVTVRGRVVKPAGATLVNVSLTAANGSMGAVNNGTNDPEGKFELRGAAPGAYTLTARSMIANKMYAAQRPIQIGADDIEGIEMTLAPPADVSGVVRMEGNTTVKLSDVRVSLLASLQGGNQATVNDEGTFMVGNLAPDVYTINFYAPGNLFLKSARCGTTEVTESGVDLTAGGGCDLTITLSANGGQIEGQVQDDDGKPAQGTLVTLIAEGKRRGDASRMTSSTDSNGHFKMVGVAPGSYRLYAWEEVNLNAVLYDPDFLKPFESSGESVQISEGDRKSVSLKRIAAVGTQ
jgi:protocatechuate 3,4-dioxygenase beta subunit